MKTAVQQEIIDKALIVLKNATGKHGIYATANDDAMDNYRAIWSRDSAIAGISGMMWGDEHLSDALLNSLKTFVAHQHPLGMIPSNVVPEANKVSYGSLVGRVDATTWFLCAVGVYLYQTKDKALRRYFSMPVERALNVLDIWEFNAKGLVYTPMSGNWADEYVTQAYTLYDQCLRLWALSLLSYVWENEKWNKKAKHIREQIKTNYQYLADAKDLRHPSAYASLKGLPYWAASFGAFGYDMRFDMSANALATILNLDETKNQSLFGYIDQRVAEEKSHLLPVFSPTISEGDEDWKYLKDNYSFSFKNQPHHFHNGGVWPVFLSWMASGFALRGNTPFAEGVWQELTKAIADDEFRFREYITGDTKQPAGVSNLCFTASGILLLDSALHQKNTLQPIFDLSHLLYEK